MVIETAYKSIEISFEKLLDEVNKNVGNFVAYVEVELNNEKFHNNSRLNYVPVHITSKDLFIEVCTWQISEVLWSGLIVNPRQFENLCLLIDYLYNFLVENNCTKGFYYDPNIIEYDQVFINSTGLIFYFFDSNYITIRFDVSD